MFEIIDINLITVTPILQSCISAANKGYDLIVIEESKVPLGVAPQQPNFYFFTVMGLLTLLIIAGIITFIIRRNTLKKRILELREKVGDINSTVRGNTRVLKDEITDLETRAAEMMNSAE